MKRVVTIAVLLAMLLTCFPAVTLATTATNTLNGEEIPFSQWTNAAFGGWEQLEDGTLVPTELTDFTMLRLEQDLGEQYTIEFDVKQEDNTSGWNTIQIGFEVNEGEIVSLIGANGAGKTTLIDTLCGIIEKTDGEVTYFGEAKETTAEIKVDETVTLTATVLPENATNKTVTWTSSDETVAIVDTNGKVTAVKAGTVIITAVANDSAHVSKTFEILVTTIDLSVKIGDVKYNTLEEALDDRKS